MQDDRVPIPPKPSTQYAQLLEMVLNASENHCYLYDRNLRFLYANPSALKMLDLAFKQVRGKHWRELGFPAQMMEPLEDELRKVFQSGEQYTGKITFTSDNESCDYKYIVTPVFEKTGAVEMALANVCDITEIERAKKQALQNEQKFRVLLESAPDGIIVVDRHGKIQMVNQQAEQLFNFPRQQLQGQSIEMLVPEYLRDIHKAHRARYNNAPITRAMGIGQILHGLRSDRIQFPVEIALSPVKIDGEFQTIAIIRDVTRRQQAEQKINHLNNDLSEKVRELSVLNEQLEAFNYSVSHDLRAPIRAINGFSKIVLEDYDERLDDTGRNYLQRIRGNCIHMDAMIDALLQLSRISNATLVVTEINLTEIATGIINELREQSPERRVKVDIEPGVTTYGDKELMAIALYNMLSNAWKYTRKREIAGISFGKEQRADEMIYYVSDNGVGFDQANSRRIFLPFARLHSADEFEGIGVGMSTVQRIIQRHGGRIWAHGKRDRGASFCFTLNAAINESTSTAAESTNSL